MFRVGNWDINLLDLGRINPPMSTLVETDPADDAILELAVNALLLRREDTTILVDTGFGITAPVLGLPETDLAGALRAHGITPEAVDILFLTHLDLDHVGGAFEGSWPDDLRSVLSNAQVLATVPEIEWSRAGGSGAVFEGGPVAVAGFGSALSTVAMGAEVAPGIRVRHAPGHTPGQAVVEVEGDPPLIFLADVIHSALLVEKPELRVLQDRDPEMGVETRLAFLEECARRDLQVLASHVPAQAPGRIVDVGGAFVWLPASAAFH